MGRTSYFFVTLVLGVGMVWWSRPSLPQIVTPISATTPVIATSKVLPPLTENLRLLVGGVPRPFDPKREIPISGDLMAKLEIQPGKERYSRIANLFLYRQTAEQPFDAARIQVTGQMRFMGHDAFHQVAEPLGNGHYVINLPFAMPEEWELDFEIDALGKQSTLELLIEFFQ